MTDLADVSDYFMHFKDQRFKSFMNWPFEGGNCCAEKVNSVVLTISPVTCKACQCRLLLDLYLVSYDAGTTTGHFRNGTRTVFAKPLPKGSGVRDYTEKEV